MGTISIKNKNMPLKWQQWCTSVVGGSKSWVQWVGGSDPNMDISIFFFIEPFPKEPLNLRMNHYYMVIDVPPI